MGGQLCVNALNVNNLSFLVYPYIISYSMKKSLKDESFTHSIPLLCVSSLLLPIQIITHSTCICQTQIFIQFVNEKIVANFYIEDTFDILFCASNTFVFYFHFRCMKIYVG